MRTFKKILVVVAILIAGIFIVGLFTKKHYSVIRETTINKPKQEVFSFIKYLENQKKYNTWLMKDPNARITTKGTDGTVGFISTWDSDNKEVGKGEQEIKDIKEGERVDYEVRFIEPFEGKADTYMETESASDSQTKVKWMFNSKMEYPMNIMMIFMDIPGMLGKDMSASLANLKGNLEKQ